MISAVFVTLFLTAFSLWFAQKLHREHPETNITVFRLLILYHALFILVYYLYALWYNSDSWLYHYKVEINYYGFNSWWEWYGVSTVFIEFLAYFFVNFLSYSYEAVMIQFGWFGLIGFFYFYVVLKERLRYEHAFLGFSLLNIILFLPNLHFWSSSLGKGSVIFMGFGLFFYALNNVSQRYIAGIIGAIIIYHVRPHILFIVLIASAWGFVFSTRGVSFSLRVVVILASLGAFYFIRDDVFALTGIDENNLFGDSTTLSSRAAGLMKAGSGVDISNYSFFQKIFTFWFRPLFFDAPGILGIIVSFENVFYLIVFSKLLRFDFIEYFRQSDHVVKASVLTFVGVSFALAQVSGNLGIAIRQKSQVMILMMFVILKFMDETKQRQDELEEQRKKVRDRRKPMQPVKPVLQVPSL